MICLRRKQAQQPNVLLPVLVPGGIKTHFPKQSKSGIEYHSRPRPFSLVQLHMSPKNSKFARKIVSIRLKSVPHATSRHACWKNQVCREFFTDFRAVLRKICSFSELVDAIFIDFRCERLPAASSQTIKTIKNQYHTNTTSFTRIPKRIKKVVNTTPIPVKDNQDCVHLPSPSIITNEHRRKSKCPSGRPGCCMCRLSPRKKNPQSARVGHGALYGANTNIYISQRCSLRRSVWGEHPRAPIAARHPARFARFAHSRFDLLLTKLWD